MSSESAEPLPPPPPAPASASARPWRGHAAAAAGLVLLAIAVCGPAVFGDQALSGIDLRYHQYPVRAFMAEQVAAGEVPLWWPHVRCGYPTQANGALLYPLSVPLWVLLGPIDATDLAALLHLALIGLAVYALARQLDLGPAGAVFAGVAAAGGGMTSGSLGWPGAMAAQASGLWALVATVAAVRAPDPRWTRRWFAAAAAAWGLAVFAGRPPRVYMLAALTVALAAGVGAARAARARGAGRAAALAMGAGALGALVGAAQLLPTLELAGLSERQEGLSAQAASLGQLRLDLEGLRLWLLGATDPHLLAGPRAESGHYLGLVTWPLALGGAAIALRRRADSPDLRWLALSIAAAAGVLLAVGDATPMFELGRTLLPGFDKLRAPARALLWTSCAGALFAGLAVSAIDARGGRTRWVAWALVALLAVDLVPYARARAHLAPQDAFAAHDPALVAALQEGGGRAAILGMPPRRLDGPAVGSSGQEPLAPNLAAAVGVRLSNGYGSLDLARRQRLLVPPGADAELVLDRLALAGTARLLTPAGFRAPGLQVVARFPALGAVVQALPATSVPPQAWFAPRVRPVAPGDFEAAEHALRAGAGYPVPVVEEAEPGPSPGGAGEVRLDRVAAGRFAGTARSERGGWVVVQESWMPGWRARVAGDPAPVLPANVAFLAVRVPPGEVALEVEYAPASWRWGLALSLAGALLVVLLAGLPARGRGAYARALQASA